jgi:hypothetical protein
MALADDITALPVAPLAGDPGHPQSHTTIDAALKSHEARLLVPTAVKTAAYTALAGQLVQCNATTASLTVTLPAATAGLRVGVAKVNADTSTNTVTIAAAGSDTISGTTVLRLPGEIRTYTAVAGQWVMDGGATTLASTDNRYVALGKTAVSADNFASINAALSALTTLSPNGGTVYLGSVTYTVTAQFTLGQGQRIVGAGKTATTILKGFAGDFAVMGDSSGLRDLTVDLQGATFTGRGLLFQGTNGNQTLTRVSILNGDLQCLDFEVAAGGNFNSTNLTATRINSGTGTGRYAVVISPTQQLSAVTRSFINFSSLGLCAIDLGGCNDLFIVSSVFADLKFTPDSRGVQISASRWLNQAAATIDGHGNSVIGCDINPQVAIAAGADNITVGPGSFNNLPVIDNSGNSRNTITHFQTSYTPTFTSTGTGAALGNGTITGSYSRAGGSVTATVKFTAGSTTAFGTGFIQMTLPTTRTNATTWGGTATLLHGATGTFYAATVLFQNGSNFVQFAYQGAPYFSGAAPVAIASGDTIDFTVTYQQ